MVARLQDFALEGIMGLRISDSEYDAILAGLRLLQAALEAGDVEPNDGDVGDILTCAGSHAGLTVEQIESLIDDMQCGARG